MTMITLDQLVTGSTPRLQAYVARPERGGFWPGVVLLHDAAGLDNATRQRADRVAESGYLVIAPDLFTDGGPRPSRRRVVTELRSGAGVSVADVAAARGWLIAQGDCTDKIGVIGFGLGGGFALLAAPDFDVCSVNYGPVPAEEALVRACPVVGSYGRRDLTLPGASLKLAEVMVRHDIAFDIKEYPNAGHGFLDDEPVRMPWYLRPMRRMMAVGPDPQAAVDAWMRIDGFLGRFLR